MNKEQGLPATLRVRQSHYHISYSPAGERLTMYRLTIQVGLRSENIMITHPESSAYHPALAHASTTTPEQWPRSSSSAAASTGAGSVPAPREPATSARGAPSSVFRHHSTSSHSSAHHVHHSTTTTPIPFDQSGITSTSSSSLPPSGSLGTVSTSSSTSSSIAAPAPDSRTSLSPTRAKRASEDTPPILLRNLGHVVELAKDDCLHAQTPPRRNRSGYEDKRRYEISSMPVGDVIEMVAGLLTKITTTNDRQHDHLQRTIPPPDSAAGMNTTTTSVLAFHGKNVPSITIMSYLSRIHKYCPTTYEVFLSLLVYFDRMTDRVNKKNTHPGMGTVTTGDHRPDTPTSASPASASDNYSPSHVFVVDSYNIHRLVIAGVTCASKFFSDVFYTNSRYAKVCHPLPPNPPTHARSRYGQVGGLPLAELNHLELQFLILNDFRLSVPVEELEAYGTMLVQFYAREAIANANLLQQGIGTPGTTPQQSSSFVEAAAARVGGTGTASA